MTESWICFFLVCLNLLSWTKPFVLSQEGVPETRVFTKEVTADKCTSGVPGPPGRPGPPGPRGDAGSTVDATPNWNSCQWNHLNNGNDVAQVVTCSITKTYSDTYLYVGISSDMRFHGGSSGCCRWYFTFNGAECSNPVKIEAVVYANGYATVNLHRPRMLIGYCKGISAGSITVGWHVGQCSGYGTYDCYSGWNSATNMWIEEVTPSPYD
ncbi:collagen triple helix repeat-containing protein 1-like [Amphiura filiformis]|uniref:collagen triple helix repeat-containing protein 1-like n=1 Tax=Amphiura filiformis TaxID=82378 RepID=UPI003B21A9C9